MTQQATPPDPKGAAAGATNAQPQARAQAGKQWTDEEHCDRVLSSINSELQMGAKYLTTTGTPLNDVNAITNTLKSDGRVIFEPHIPARAYDQVLGAQGKARQLRTEGKAESER